jgi:hypothetical protein
MILVLALFVAAQAQDPGVQQKLAAIKQSIQENQAKLRGYQWTETTEVSIKGELKNRKQASCHYGPDGQVVRTPIGEPSAPAKRRGLKGKIAAGKIEERLGSLIGRYVPPNPQSMQTSFQSGKASLSSGGDIVFKDYAKMGDQVTYSMDTAAKKLRSFNVATYLDGKEDAVTLDVTFQALPDGANAINQAVIESKEKHLQIKRTNSAYTKVAR